MVNEFVKKYESKIEGIISCFDRVVIKGTLPSVSYTDAVTGLLYRNGILLKDFQTFMTPYRNQLHERAKQIAAKQGIAIEFIRKSKVRKEDIVQKHLQERKITNGLVCILSAMESCQNYVYRYDKKTRRSYLKMTSGKCLHYYFYFIDDSFCLCYMSVPTWCPFRLQFYFNAHNWLAKQLDKADIGYELVDNAFTYIEDYDCLLYTSPSPRDS